MPDLTSSNKDPRAAIPARQRHQAEKLSISAIDVTKRLLSVGRQLSYQLPTQTCQDQVKGKLWLVEVSQLVAGLHCLSITIVTGRREAR